jgi:hypothetical protein
MDKRSLSAKTSSDRGEQPSGRARSTQSCGNSGSRRSPLYLKVARCLNHREKFVGWCEKRQGDPVFALATSAVARCRSRALPHRRLTAGDHLRNLAVSSAARGYVSQLAKGKMSDDEKLILGFG